MNLNKNQKIFMASIGIAIFIFQIYIFYEDGVEGYKWIFSALISVGLILPIIGNSDDGKKIKKIETHNSELSKSEFEELDNKTNLLVATVSIEAALLFNKIHKILKVSPAANQEQAAILALMMDQWRIYCVAYIAVIVALCEAYKNKAFGEFESKMFKFRILEEMVKISKSSAEKNKTSMIFDIDSEKKWAIKDFEDADEALSKMLTGFSNKVQDPDLVFIEYLVQKMKLPDGAKGDFIKEIRPYTKNLMGSLKK